jgi:hypothetical protein
LELADGREELAGTRDTTSRAEFLLKVGLSPASFRPDRDPDGGALVAGDTLALVRLDLFNRMSRSGCWRSGWSLVVNPVPPPTLPLANKLMLPAVTLVPPDVRPEVMSRSSGDRSRTALRSGLKLRLPAAWMVMEPVLPWWTTRRTGDAAGGASICGAGAARLDGPELRQRPTLDVDVAVPVSTGRWASG